MDVEDLKSYVEEKGIEAKFYEFSEPTLSVEDSARQLGIDPERIVKSLVFKDQEGDPVLAVVSGVYRVDIEKLSKAHGTEVRMAKAREVEDFTGYKIGEVPPVATGLKTYMDSEASGFSTVYAGGGSTHTLIEIDPGDIVEATDASLVDLRERDQ